MSNRGMALAAALIAAALLAPCTQAAGKARTYNGAIAYHRDSQSWGYATNKLTAREAQVEALRQCGHERCEVVSRLRNNCGSVANGPRRFTVGAGATREESQIRALRTCGERCEIVAWACTR